VEYYIGALLVMPEYTGREWMRTNAKLVASTKEQKQVGRIAED